MNLSIIVSSSRIIFVSNLTTKNDLLSVNNASTMAGIAVDPTEVFGPQRDSLLIVIPITIVYSVIFVMGLIGNIFTCIVIVKNNSMHTATNYYLFSLAISDLLLLIVGLPQEMYSIWFKWPYRFGEAFCLLRGLAAETSTNASISTITLFTIERYLAICHPLQSHKMSKLSRALRHILILWICSLGFALPQALQFGIRHHEGVPMCLQTRVIIDHAFELSTGLFFGAPMVLISVMYLLIGLRLKKTSQERLTQDLEQYTTKRALNLPRSNIQSTKRVINMLVAVVVAFFICWAPFHAQRLVYIYGSTENHMARAPVLHTIYIILTYSSGILYYVSTCINPILYHIMSKKFRIAFKNTLVWCRLARPAPDKRLPSTALALVRAPNASGSANTAVNTTRKETSFCKKTSFNAGARRSSQASSGCPRWSAPELATQCSLRYQRVASLARKEKSDLFNKRCYSGISKCTTLKAIRWSGLQTSKKHDISSTDPFTARQHNVYSRSLSDIYKVKGLDEKIFERDRRKDQKEYVETSLNNINYYDNIKTIISVTITTEAQIHFEDH